MSALTRWFRKAVSAPRALINHLCKRNSPVREHGPGLLLWVARLLVEWYLRSRW
jgi:hypothetical protein